MKLEDENHVWAGFSDPLPEFELNPHTTAFLIVDMQYLDAHPDFGCGLRAQEAGVGDRYRYYFNTIKDMIPRIKALQEVCRSKSVELVFVTIASHKGDGRDISLEHKRVGLIAQIGSKEAQILEEIAPRDNELVLTKGCSGVFNGTAVDQLLRNMGIDTLIVAGVATNYCVETAVRDAADRGYSVVLLSDACAATTPEDHAFALRILSNVYCKVKRTKEVIDLIGSTSAESGAADGGRARSQEPVPRSPFGKRGGVTS